VAVLGILKKGGEIVSNYCTVIVGIHGSKSQQATVHSHWCGSIIEDVCEAMLTGNRAIAAYLDGDDPVSVKVEIGIIAGTNGVPIKWHKCKVEEPVNKRYRVNSGGAISVTAVKSERKIGCTYCGAPNPVQRMNCTGCGESLYDSMSHRMAEYNRRLREGIKEHDQRLVAISRQMIMIAVNAVGDDGRWSVDENGFAHESKRVREPMPEYRMKDEEDAL
jgi:hypothetical protein